MYLCLIMTYQQRDYKLVRLSGTVTHVADGDTIDVEVSYGAFGTRKEQLRIRFAGVDTPEVKEQQPFAEEAKQVVIDKVLNRRVSVTVAELKGSRQYITGTHGRVVGIIHPSWFGLSLNIELVKCGLAKVYPKSACSWMVDSLWRELLDAEKQAKRKRLKIWNVSTQPSPSQFWPLVYGVLIGLMLCVLFLIGW